MDCGQRERQRASGSDEPGDGCLRHTEGAEERRRQRQNEGHGWHVGHDVDDGRWRWLGVVVVAGAKEEATGVVVGAKEEVVAGVAALAGAKEEVLLGAAAEVTGAATEPVPTTQVAKAKAGERQLTWSSSRSCGRLTVI